MKKVAILSDIHGNLQALTAVLDAIDTHDVDEIWCLGDTVGYGANPLECLEIVRTHCSVALCGNHDLAALNSISRLDFNSVARESLDYTAQCLLTDTPLASWLESLPTYLTRPRSYQHVELTHASPADPVWDYVIDEEDAKRAWQASDPDTHLVCVGHSHLQLHFSKRGDYVLRAGPILRERRLLAPGHVHLINPGSVGQPRDGGNTLRPVDARACFAIIELETNIPFACTWYGVDYDIELAAKSIREAGLPEQNATRLFHRE